MRRTFAALLSLGLGIAVTFPAHSALQVWFDGATDIFATQAPYWLPPSGGEPYGMISFWYASTGQLTDGYVTIYEVQHQSYDESALEIRLTNPSTRRGFGQDCPDIAYDAYLYGWYQQNLDKWANLGCDGAPDWHMYSSGKKMGLILYATSDVYWTYWIWTQIDDIMPMDGREYNVQIYYSTGDYYGPGPWVNVFVTPKWSYPVPAVSAQYNGVVYSDGSNNAFNIPLADNSVWWRVGSHGGDAVYCYRGGVAELYHMPWDSELIPYASTLGQFITRWGTGQFLGDTGEIPFNYSPAIYLGGDDSSFVVNHADINDVFPPQIFSVEGFTVPWNPAVGPVTGGVLYADWQDPF